MRNTCFVIGNLGSDPVERSRNEKTGPVVGFTVAENVQAFDKETQQYKTVHTNWFNVTIFGNLAERAKGSVRKGDRVAVNGRMKISKFTDKSGQDRTSFEIIAEDIAHWHALPSAGAGASAGTSAGTGPTRSSERSQPPTPSSPSNRPRKRESTWEDEAIPF